MPAKEVMPKFHRGTLHSGSGHKVTNLQQALAIASSEHQKEKEHGGHYPEGHKKKKKSMGEALRGK